MKFNRYFSVLVIFAFIIFLAGCGKMPVDSNKKVIEFWTLQLSDFAPYINKVIADYEKLHPDVEIKWIDVPFSEGEKRSLAAVMSNKVPDVINMNPSFGSTLASRHALIDVKKYVFRDDYNKYLPESWDASRLRDVTFGIPWYITTSVTIYNSQMMRQAGLNPDNPPETYEELKNYAKIIKEKTGKYAFMPNLTEDGQMVKIFNRYDIPIVNQSADKALFNTPEAVKIVNFWFDMYKKGYIPPESLTETHRASLERYQAGESAFILTGANFLKMIKENAPQVYSVTKVAPQITGSNKKVEFALMNLVVPVKSKHPKEAVDFALFLTNSQNQLEFCKLAPILPSTLEAINSDFFRKKADKDLIGKASALSARQLNNALKPIPPLQNQKDLFQIIDYMTQQVLLGQKSPKPALDEAVKEWDKILKEK